MLDGTFLTTLKNYLQPGAVTVDGKSYSTAPLHNLPLPTEPPFPGVKLWTLDSLVDYIEQNRDKQEIATEAQILCAAQIVQLISPPRGENRKRAAFIIAAWGADKMAHDRGKDVKGMIRFAGHKMHALGVGKSGQPFHPLYIPYERATEVYQ